MHLWWFITIIVYLHGRFYKSAHGYPWLERYHYPGGFTAKPSKYVNGSLTLIADIEDTPDYRVEEPDFQIHDSRFPNELERPYRNSPVYKQAVKSDRSFQHDYFHIELQTGCYCNTVYRRHILLAGCATITSRHILTTATPTLLILRSYSHLPNLEGILGGWYDIGTDVFNSSMYMTPSRIHIHPKYRSELEVNVSHPIPAMYDLAVWAATYTFHRNVVICQRASSSWDRYTHSIPQYYDASIVVGFMFMKSYHRRPLPWFRFIVKTRSHVWPCPKTEWQWFHCVAGENWGKYGFDSGGGMHSFYRSEKGEWRKNGIIGMCSFSMKLRSKLIVHYFTVIDNYPVLNFLYDAFLGLTKNVYLDSRFEDTRWAAPVPWWGEYIANNYFFGENIYYSLGYVPKYRR